MSNRAARNATCCAHAADDHDLWGCAVNVSTSSRAYERCHLLVPIGDTECTICGSYEPTHGHGPTGFAR
jgi:hypothetical protein